MRNLNAFPLKYLSMKEDKYRKLSCSISAVVAGVIIISFYYFTQNPYVLLLVTNVYICEKRKNVFYL